MNILITGAGGFLGKNISNILTSDPTYSIFGCDIYKILNAEFVDRPNFYFFQESFLNSKMEDILKGIDVVIHTARTIKPGLGFTDYEKDIKENILGTIKLYEQSVKLGVKKFIFISSGGTVYGNFKGGQDTAEGTHNENQKCQPVGYYGMSMFTIENYLQLMSEKRDANLVILRLSNPFGPFQQFERGQGIINVLFENHFFGKQSQIWGDGTAIRDYLFVEDVAHSINKAIAYQGKEELFNIGSKSGRSIIEIVEDIETVLGEKLKLIWDKSKNVEVKKNVLDTSKANQHLSWQPTTNWIEGLEKTKNYYSQLKNLSNQSSINFK